MKRRESIPGLLLGLLLAGSTYCLGAEAEDVCLPPSTTNLLPQATLSGNFESLSNREEGRPSAIVYNHATGRFVTNMGFHHEYRAGWIGSRVESNPAYWMATWNQQIQANLIVLSGGFTDVSQPNTSWKIELRRNGSWVEHARGTGGWYDGGRYFWGGPNTTTLSFDAIRVSLFGSNVHAGFRGEVEFSWVVGQCAPIDAFIAPVRQTRRAGRPESFVAQPLGGNITSWSWNFGDGRTANGANVSNTYTNPGTYQVILTFSDGTHTGSLSQSVVVDSPIDVRIVPLSGPVRVRESVLFRTQVAAGNPTQFSWNFGDGSTAVGSQVQKTYSQAGIYRVTVEASDGGNSGSSIAIVRVHTPETVGVPQVLLDTDAKNEVDDQHYIGYALFSQLDVLGINSVHHNAVIANTWTEQVNYDEILNIIDLARRSGLPRNGLPAVDRGAQRRLTVPFSGRWDDTEPIATAASAAILAAARGASPENPVWVVPVGPGTNVASAILQARAEGLDLAGRIRIMWLGGHNEGLGRSWNGTRNDPWSIYVIGQSVVQSGVETWFIPEPVGGRLRVDARTEGDLYPQNPLGDYLRTITAEIQYAKSIYDTTALSAIISQRLGLGWISTIDRVEVAGPNQGYRWIPSSNPGAVRIIRAIDPEAMKKDMFDTLNGSPTPLIGARPADPISSAGRERKVSKQ